MERKQMTVQEAAAELGLSVRAVLNRIERGELHAERMGARLWVIPASEIARQRAIGRLKPGPKPAPKAPPRPRGRPRKVTP